MNTANLQLEGLYLALAAINRALVSSGVLTADQLNAALDDAAATAQRDGHDVSAANRDAVTFPIRFLRQANRDDDGETATFSELARLVGETSRLNW